MTSDSTVRVRFAPSPTGELHLGGARTALFNWLFARHNGGKLFLRIEDTDRVRSKAEYTDQICDSLKWLGLTWDGPLLFQSKRTAVYHAAIKTLVSSGNAYRCFCSQEKLESDRKDGEFKYDGTCRYLSSGKVKDRLNSGQSFAIRLKIPEGETIFDDRIYKEIKVNHRELDDFIIVRSDGSPTYNLVVVVDDHDMGITHVIRGEDHIANTPKQLLIYSALGYEKPVFAHLPMILGPDKKRLSKRHGAPGIQKFRNEGHLPEALLNYLVLLGWNPGSDQEIFTLDELVELFEISQVQKKGAVYDEKKLHWVSGQHVMRTPTDALLTSIRTLQPEWGNGKDISFLIVIIELLKERAKSLTEFQEQSLYFFDDPEKFDEQTARKRWKDYTINIQVSAYLEKLGLLPEWRSETIESTLREIAEAEKISAGKLIHPVRLALSGVPHGPSLFSMMQILGRDVCIRRLEKALSIFPLSEKV